MDWLLLRGFRVPEGAPSDSLAPLIDELPCHNWMDRLFGFLQIDELAGTSATRAL